MNDTYIPLSQEGEEWRWAEEGEWSGTLRAPIGTAQVDYYKNFKHSAVALCRAFVILKHSVSALIPYESGIICPICDRR